MINRLLCLTLSICVIFSVQATAADFQPTVLQLSVQDEVEYAFDGKVLDFTVEVEGLPAAAWLVINTSGKAGSISLPCCTTKTERTRPSTKAETTNAGLLVGI